LPIYPRKLIICFSFFESRPPLRVPDVNCLDLKRVDGDSAAAVAVNDIVVDVIDRCVESKIIMAGVVEGKTLVEAKLVELMGFVDAWSAMVSPDWVITVSEVGRLEFKGFNVVNVLIDRDFSEGIVLTVSCVSVSVILMVLSGDTVLIIVKFG